MSKENRVSAEDRLRLHVADPETFEFSFEDADALVEEIDALRSKPVAGVEVKRLYWESAGELCRAETAFGFSYYVNPRTSMWIGQADDWALADDPSNAAEADYRQRILSTLSLPAQEPEETRILYRHQKRGTFYELIGIGKMQSENWESVEFSESLGCNMGLTVDMEEVAVYRSLEDPHEIWVRPRGEFEDGRFAAQTAALKEA